MSSNLDFTVKGLGIKTGPSGLNTSGRIISSIGNPNGQTTLQSPDVGTLCIDSTTGDVYKFVSGTIWNPYVSRAYFESVLGTNPQGGASTVQERLTTISNFASPNAGGYISGNYYDNSFHGLTSGTRRRGSNNTLELSPFFTNIFLTIDQLGVAVSTSNGTGTVSIYTSGNDGWPSEKVFETPTINMGSTGYAGATVSFTFLPGVLYWFGTFTTTRPTLRAVNLGSSVNLGLASNNGTGTNSIISLTEQSTPTPTTLPVIIDSMLLSLTPISVRFRAV